MGIKTFKSDYSATAGVTASKVGVRMHGTKDNYVQADERGVTISGPVSFVAGSSQIRYGGGWTMNTELALSLPSTMATPSPVMIVDLPAKQAATLIAEASVMIGLLGGLTKNA